MLVHMQNWLRSSRNNQKAIVQTPSFFCWYSPPPLVHAHPGLAQSDAACRTHARAVVPRRRPFGSLAGRRRGPTRSSGPSCRCRGRSSLCAPQHITSPRRDDDTVPSSRLPRTHSPLTLTLTLTRSPRRAPSRGEGHLARRWPPTTWRSRHDAVSRSGRRRLPLGLGRAVEQVDERAEVRVAVVRKRDLARARGGVALIADLG